MKKQLLLLSVCLLSVASVFAQKINKSELRALQAFLNQPAVVASTNAQALKISDLNNPGSWEGIKIEKGQIAEINWAGKNLAGELDLSGFTNLQKVNVSRNRLSSVKVDNTPSLNYLNAGNNRLTSTDVRSYRIYVYTRTLCPH